MGPRHALDVPMGGYWISSAVDGVGIDDAILQRVCRLNVQFLQPGLMPYDLRKIPQKVRKNSAPERIRPWLLGRYRKIPSIALGGAASRLR